MLTSQISWLIGKDSQHQGPYSDGAQMNGIQPEEISRLREEIEELKTVMVPYLEQVAKKQKLDMVFFMLTNVMEVGTELLCYGKNAKELAIQAFKLPEDTESIYLQDVVSRKKQLIPAFVVSLQH